MNWDSQQKENVPFLPPFMAGYHAMSHGNLRKFGLIIRSTFRASWFYCLVSKGNCQIIRLVLFFNISYPNLIFFHEYSRQVRQMVLIPGWSKNSLSSESLTDLLQVTQALLTASLLWFPLTIHAMAWNLQWGQADSSVSLSSEQNWLWRQLTSTSWYDPAVKANKRLHWVRADAVPLLCSGNLPINSFFSNNFLYVKKANQSFCILALFYIILVGLKSVHESEAISGNTTHITCWNPGFCS